MTYCIVFKELKAKGKPVVFLSNSSRLTSTNFKTMEIRGNHLSDTTCLTLPV